MQKTCKWKLTLVIIAISFTQGLQFTVSPVLGQIQAHFPNASVSMVQMLVTIPAFLSMFVALAAGKLVTVVTKKQLLLFGCFISGISGLLPFVADSFELLFASRALYGVGLGLATVLNTVVVADFFEGGERVAMMGIQGASVGSGMLIESYLSGVLGSMHFTYVYFVHIIAFICLAVILFCLPERGKVVETKENHIQLNGQVFYITALGFLEFLFLITFSTNIAMHLSGALKGNSSVSGMLISVFSAIMIVCGLILNRVYKVTGKYTLGICMASFAFGAIVFVFFSDNLPMLVLGAALCGISQGFFVPQAMCDLANSVNAASTAMATAIFTCGQCCGQTVSPYVTNFLSRTICGSVSTGNVYLVGGVAMLIISGIVLLVSKKQK